MSHPADRSAGERPDPEESKVERRFLGVVEVDSGSVLVGDPSNLLARRVPAEPGFDLDDLPLSSSESVSSLRGLSLLLQNFGGDGPYPVFGEFEGSEFLRATIEFEPIDLDEDA